jgi:hypothetical protein
MPEADCTLKPNFAGVRPAMSEHVRHARQDRRINVPTVKMQDSGNTAHVMNWIGAAETAAGEE